MRRKVKIMFFQICAKFCEGKKERNKEKQTGTKDREKKHVGTHTE